MWPPYRPPNPTVIAPMLGGDPRLYSGDWWKVKQEEARALQARQEREEKEREAKALVP